MNFDYLIVFLCGAAASWIVWDKKQTRAAFKKGFKQGYKQGCMHAKMAINLFDNEDGNPSAQFYRGEKSILTMANYPPEG